MDTVRPSSAAVSARMSRQPSKNTTAELAVRRLLHAARWDGPAVLGA
ncbi:hypothetical protein [Streptomyces sp. NPDC094437]